MASRAEVLLWEHECPVVRAGGTYTLQVPLRVPLAHGVCWSGSFTFSGAAPPPLQSRPVVFQTLGRWWLTPVSPYLLPRPPSRPHPAWPPSLDGFALLLCLLWASGVLISSVCRVFRRHPPPRSGTPSALGSGPRGALSRPRSCPSPPPAGCACEVSPLDTPGAGCARKVPKTEERAFGKRYPPFPLKHKELRRRKIPLWWDVFEEQNWPSEGPMF